MQNASSTKIVTVALHHNFSRNCSWNVHCHPNFPKEREGRPDERTATALTSTPTELKKYKTSTATPTEVEKSNLRMQFQRAQVLTEPSTATNSRIIFNFNRCRNTCNFHRQPKLQLELPAPPGTETELPNLNSSLLNRRYTCHQNPCKGTGAAQKKKRATRLFALAAALQQRSTRATMRALAQAQPGYSPTG